MSIALMTAAWEADVSSTDVLVLLALADWANETDGGRCWPSIKKLCERSKLCERAVQSSIKRLCEADHIHRQIVDGKGVNYYVHPRIKRTPAVDAPPQQVRDTPAADAPNTLDNHQKGKAIALPSSDAPKSEYPASFEKLWTAYPRHQGKGAAHKAWVKAGKRIGGGLKARDKMQAAVEAYAAHPPDNPQFIPMLATWLNQSRYDDPIEELGNGRSNAPANLQPRNGAGQHTDRLAAGLRLLDEFTGQQEAAASGYR